jgi:hypothetical protein
VSTEKRPVNIDRTLRSSRDVGHGRLTILQPSAEDQDLAAPLSRAGERAGGQGAVVFGTMGSDRHLVHLSGSTPDSTSASSAIGAPYCQVQ